MVPLGLSMVRWARCPNEYFFKDDAQQYSRWKSEKKVIVVKKSEKYSRYSLFGTLSLKATIPLMQEPQWKCDIDNNKGASRVLCNNRAPRVTVVRCVIEL